MDRRVSLAELARAGICLRTSEAVTIVRELTLRVARGELRGIASPAVMRVSTTGEISIDGPVAAGQLTVARAAKLLETVLETCAVRVDDPVRRALDLVLARARRVEKPAAYPSLERFAHTLGLFASADPRVTARDLALRVVALTASAEDRPAGQDAVEPIPINLAGVRRNVDRPFHDPSDLETSVPPADGRSLTISDIRRARRATGLTLDEIATRSRIPVALLRQLEWGYLRNWPAGLYGRTQLIRYSRAAGLDEQMVVSSIWPLLQMEKDEPLVSGPELAGIAPAPRETIEIIQLEFPQDAVLFPSEEVLPPARAASWDSATLHNPGRAGDARLAEPTSIRVGGARLVRVFVIGSVLVTGMLLLLRVPVERSPASTATGTTTTGRPTERAENEPPDPLAGREARNSAGSNRADRKQRSHPSRTNEPSSPSLGLTPLHAHRAEGLAADAVTYSPTFGPVGNAIFYHAQSAGRSALLRADTDSKGEVLHVTRLIDDDSRNFHVRPSPDGSHIAFDSDRDGERAVYVADADGTHAQRVSGEGYAAVPSWSPDGESLAFIRGEQLQPRVWNLWLLHRRTGELRRLTSHRYGQAWGASWFPDGRRIAYSHEDRLIVLNVVAGGRRVFRSPRAGQLVRTPAVSPDGGRVIFQVFRDGAWLLDVATATMHKVIADPSAEEYTWSPDGQRIAYHSRQSGKWGVWIMAAP
jgi:hypothetical protein